MKKLLSLFLCAVLTLCLAACATQKTPAPTDGTDDPTQISATAEPTQAPTQAEETPTELTMPDYDAALAQELVGTWRLDSRISGQDMGIEDFDTDILLPLLFTFNADGSYSLGYVESELDASLDQFYQALLANMADTMYATMAENDLDKETADAAFQEAYGQTIEEYCQSVVDSLGISDAIKGLAYTGTYSVENGTLYTGNQNGLGVEADAFTVSGDTLTLSSTGSPDTWKSIGVTMPVEMTRYNG